MKPNEVQLIRLSDMAPNNIQSNGKAGIEEKSMNLVATSAIEIEDKSVDLVSITSEDYKEEDAISFDEGRLQQWNFTEFRMQLMGSIAGIILLFGCGIISAWAVTDLVKDVQVNGNEWIDVDYGWDLFGENEEEFFESRHVIIAIVVLSWNVGYIIGAMLGAFIVPVLPNRTIYALGAVCMAFNGYTLRNHTSAFYCAKSRVVTGLIFGLIQIALIVQAAESTTKKVRRWILVIVAYAGALANLASILLFYFYDDREKITYSEDNPTMYIISYIMIGSGLIALALNFIFTTDTIPFHLNHGEETKAFKEMTRLKTKHLSMLDIRYEYERIRFDATQAQLEGNRSLGAGINFVPLTTMCCIRILNLLFNSVPMTLLLIWDPETSGKSDKNEFDDIDSTVAPETTQNIKYVSPLLTLAILQGFRLVCSLMVAIRQDKYHFNRFCYKLAFLTGFTLLFWFIVRVVLNRIQTLQNIFFFPVSIIIMMGFTGLPIPLDIIQLCQSADSYSRIRNTWSLAAATFVENLVHMGLIVQMDIIFGVMFVYFINGVAMMYFSFWLLKNMPNVVAIHPITVAIVARYPFKHVGNEQSIHI